MDWYIRRFATENDVVAFLNKHRFHPDQVRITVMPYAYHGNYMAELWRVFYYAPEKIIEAGAVLA